MNCATHSDTAAVAFCRTCGKPLCNNCTRDVRGVIYCEACLAARMEGQAPAAGICSAGTDGVSARGRWHRHRRQAGQFRAKSCGRRNSRRIFPLRRGRGLCSAVRQGTGAPRHHGAADHRREFRSALVHAHVPRESQSDSSTSTRSLTQCAAAKAIQMGEPAPDPFGLAADIWRRARSSKAPKFRPEPRFSSAWACCSCCTPRDSSSSAWIVSGR